MVGIFGNIRFRVSRHNVLTFQNMKREISTTWNTLDRISQEAACGVWRGRPAEDFVGDNAGRVSGRETEGDAADTGADDRIIESIRSGSWKDTDRKTSMGDYEVFPGFMILCCVAAKSTKQPLAYH